MDQLVGEADDLVVTNYKQEFQKIESISLILIQMITDYKAKL